MTDKRKPIRVYIAGPLTPKGLRSSNLAIDYLMNVRNMIEMGKQCILAGMSPFVPGIDFNFFFNLREGENITEKMIKDYSIDWLLACDAVLLLPGWSYSRGTLDEINIASKENIPVFYTFESLVRWKNAVHNT